MWKCGWMFLHGGHPQAPAHTAPATCGRGGPPAGLCDGTKYTRQGRRATTTTDKGGDKNTSRRRLKKGANCSPGRHRIPLDVVGARALSRPPGRRPGCLDRSRCSIVHQRQPTGGSCRRIHASSQPSYPYEYPYPNAQKFQFNRVEPRRRRPAGTAGSSEVGNFTCPPPLETSSLGLPRPVCCARADYSGLRTSTYLRVLVRARGHGSSKFSLLPLLDAARLELHCTALTRHRRTSSDPRSAPLCWLCSSRGRIQAEPGRSELLMNCCVLHSRVPALVSRIPGGPWPVPRRTAAPTAQGTSTRTS